MFQTKYYSIFIIGVFLFTLLACKKEKLGQCIQIEYNKDFQAQVGNKYCLNDTNYLILNKVDNQICPCTADCIWEGEYILDFKVVANSVEYNYVFGSSDHVLEVPPFKDFNIKFVSTLPIGNCGFIPQYQYKVTLQVEK